MDKPLSIVYTLVSYYYIVKKLTLIGHFIYTMPYLFRPSTYIKTSFSNRGIPGVKVIPEPKYSRFDYTVIDKNGRVSLIEWKGDYNASSHASLSS